MEHIILLLLVQNEPDLRKAGQPTQFVSEFIGEFRFESGSGAPRRPRLAPEPSFFPIYPSNYTEVGLKDKSHSTLGRPVCPRTYIIYTYI